MSFHLQPDSLVQYWSNLPPSPTNSVFLDTMETTLVAPVEQHRVSTFLPRRFSTTTPPVSPALISSNTQNLGLVTHLPPASNSSNGWSNVHQPVFQLPPTPKSPNPDKRTRNRSTSSEISTENTSSEIIKNGICEKDSVMKVQSRLRPRDDRNSCNSNESPNSEVKKFSSKVFTKWLQTMVTVKKHLDNYKYTLEYTVRLLKNWPENHEEIAKLILDEIRRLNSAENSYRNAKAAYLHILLVDKILRDQDMKIEYAKFFEKYKIMAAFLEVPKRLTKSPEKLLILLKIEKYWHHVFSKRDLISCKKKNAVATNSTPHFYEINNSDHSSQLHSASMKVIKQKNSTPAKIVKASNLDHNPSSQKNKTRAENCLPDPRLKPLPNNLPGVPHKLTTRPVSPLQTIFPLVNINERTDNIPVVSHNKSRLVSAKIRPRNPNGFSVNSLATVSSNNSLLDPAKTQKNNLSVFIANTPATIPPKNSLQVSAKIRPRNPNGFSANSLATVSPNNSLLDPAETQTKNPPGVFANSRAAVPSNNSLPGPKTQTNNPPGVSANSLPTVSPNNSLLVSAKTNNLPKVSATVPINDSPTNPAPQSKTNDSFEDKSSQEPSWEDLHDMLDTITMEQAKCENNSKKDSKKRMDTKESQLTSLDSEINETRKKSENKEKTSVKQKRPNQDIQVNPTLSEQSDVRSITSASPQYYRDEDICEDNSSRPSEVATTIPFQIAPTTLSEQSDVGSISSASPQYYRDEDICEDNSSRPSEVATAIPFQIAPTEDTDISPCSSIQSNITNTFKRPEMIMEPLPPLLFPSAGSNDLWEEENLSQRFPLKCTKDDSFEICDLVDKIHHYYVDLKCNVTFREVYDDVDAFGSIQIWHSANSSSSFEETNKKS